MHVGTHGTIRTYQYCTYLSTTEGLYVRGSNNFFLSVFSYKNTYVSYVCTETFREEDPSLAIKYIISICANIFNIIAKPGSSASTATSTSCAVLCNQESATAVFQILFARPSETRVERDVSLERGYPAAQHLLSLL